MRQVESTYCRNMLLRRAAVILALAAVSTGAYADDRFAHSHPDLRRSLPASIERLGTEIPLSAGPHLGYIVGFERLSSQLRAEASLRREEAIAAGMDIGRVQLDWGELEPEAGGFDQDALDDAFARLDAAGLRPMLTFSTIDTGELTLPSDLMTDDRQDLRAGLTFDHPNVLKRLNTVLDWLVPQLATRGVWAIALGNESDMRLERRPEDADAMIAFFHAGARRVNAIAPEMAATTTLTGDALDDQPVFTHRLIEGLDAVSFNFYCIDGDNLTISDRSTWLPSVDRWLDAAGSRPVFIQELGCPVGWDDVANVDRPSVLGGADLDIQREFFEVMFGKMERDHRLHAAIVFQLYDWSPQLSRDFSDMLLSAEKGPGAQIAIDRLEEWLATVGLCRWEDATCRPAWAEFLQAQRRFAAEPEHRPRTGPEKPN